MSALRVLLIGGAFSYRALFNWVHPAMFVPVLIALPAFQILFFVSLGRAGGREPDSFFIVGNATQSCAMATLYGSIMVIANDRNFGTLPFVFVTPARRTALFLGRGLPFLANGMLVSAFGFALSWLVLDFRPVTSTLLELVAVIGITVASCTAFGLALGSIGLRAREPTFAATLAYSLMLLLCGVNVPLERLPAALEVVGHALPLTHGISGARRVAAGAPLGDVAGSVAAEIAVGTIYVIAAFLLFRYFEEDARRHGTLEQI